MIKITTIFYFKKKNQKPKNQKNQKPKTKKQNPPTSTQF